MSCPSAYSRLTKLGFCPRFRRSRKTSRDLLLFQNVENLRRVLRWAIVEGNGHFFAQRRRPCARQPSMTGMADMLPHSRRLSRAILYGFHRAAYRRCAAPRHRRNVPPIPALSVWTVERGCNSASGHWCGAKRVHRPGSSPPRRHSATPRNPPSAISCTWFKRSDGVEKPNLVLLTTALIAEHWILLIRVPGDRDMFGFRAATSRRQVTSTPPSRVPIIQS